MHCQLSLPLRPHHSSATAFSACLWMAVPVSFVFALACYYCLSCLSITRIVCYSGIAFIHIHEPSLPGSMVGCGAWRLCQLLFLRLTTGDWSSLCIVTCRLHIKKSTFRTGREVRRCARLPDKHLSSKDCSPPCV